MIDTDRKGDLFVDARRGDDSAVGDREHPLRTFAEVSRRWNEPRVVTHPRYCYLYVEDADTEQPSAPAALIDDSGWSLRPDGTPNVQRWIKMGTAKEGRFYLSSKYDPSLLYRALGGRPHGR